MDSDPLHLITSPRILLFHHVSVLLSHQLTQSSLNLFSWWLQTFNSLFFICLSPNSLCSQQAFMVASSLKDKLELSEFCGVLRTQNSKIILSASSGTHSSLRESVINYVYMQEEIAVHCWL